ncbi:MAG: D-glycero-beta-D-manno-heptose-7-phosphate kinase [Rhodobacterales bacterium]|nr:D-glycero-beta-D-manno-heptose-7-phosphate kinase [Rhodobacterales bacterium]
MTTANAALIALVERLGRARVLVVGDAMLDHFVTGAVDRISPEAPIPVLRVERETELLGGACNVARNIAALGAQVRVVAVTGDDAAGRRLKDALVDGDGQVEAALVPVADRPTPIKTRYMAGGQQLLRTDRERIAPIDGAAEDRIIEAAKDGLRHAGVVILSDYGKGVLTDRVLAAVIAAANAAGRPVIVDPKGSDYGRYRGATLATPNLKELAEAAGRDTAGSDAVVAACRQVTDACGLGGILATRSAEGMSLVMAGAEPVHLPAEAREVFDVSGAGDTVVATLATGLAAGADLATAAALANVAAGIVVAKVGTAAAYADDIVTALRHRDLDDAGARLLPLHQAQDRVEQWRRRGLSVGFTNGCFDLLHPGHVHLLAQARAACDRLVVGLNSDSSVRRLKGDSRPVQSEASRAAVLASLESVDMVVIFAEDTPLETLKALRPDLLVKGADYTVDTVVGAQEVQSWGGRVLLAELADGHSTTATISRMNAKD